MENKEISLYLLDFANAKSDAEGRVYAIIMAELYTAVGDSEFAKKLTDYATGADNDVLAIVEAKLATKVEQLTEDMKSYAATIENLRERLQHVYP